MSTRTAPSIITPNRPPRRATCAARALATSVLVGMQPVLTQVPPKRLRSMIATRLPAAANRWASAGPDWPVPMMMASYRLVVIAKPLPLELPSRPPPHVASHPSRRKVAGPARPQARLGADADLSRVRRQGKGRCRIEFILAANRHALTRAGRWVFQVRPSCRNRNQSMRCARRRRDPMPDVWSMVRELDGATRERLAEVLETRGADPQQQAMRRSFLADIAFPPRAHVLEVGCGTGVLSRALAALAGRRSRWWAWIRRPRCSTRPANSPPTCPISPFKRLTAGPFPSRPEPSMSSFSIRRFLT